MTNVRDTSLDAYFYIRGNGIDLNQQGRIYTHLQLFPEGKTRLEISNAIGITINAVCGRVNTMIEDGYLIEGARRKCSISGREAYPVMVKERQRGLFDG